MKLIPLNHGLFASVDDEDYEAMLTHTWHAHWGGNTVYAITNIPKEGGGWERASMHRMLNKTPPGLFTDHIDGHGLNNTKGNLRTATPTENGRNRAPNKSGTSKYKGVYWRKERSRWQASIRVNGRLIKLGDFKSEEQAAATYDAAAIRYFGEFARISGVKT